MTALYAIDWLVIWLFRRRFGIAWWAYLKESSRKRAMSIFWRDATWAGGSSERRCFRRISARTSGRAGRSGATDGVAMGALRTACVVCWCLMGVGTVLYAVQGLTMPEFLERRFSPSIDCAVAISLVAYVLTKLAVGIAGGVVFAVMIPDLNLWGWIVSDWLYRGDRADGDLYRDGRDARWLILQRFRR